VDIAGFDPREAMALVGMWRESFEFGVGITDPHPIAEQVAFLLDRLAPANTMRVAVIEGRIVGFSATTPESVAALYVRVGHIGQGIGSTLLRLAKEDSAGSLWLYTFARNARARRFYERHGFVAVAHGFEPEWQLEDVRYEWTRDGAPG
jgi:ribosomal protein S18 acetylase RimI-like enzyme